MAKDIQEQLRQAILDDPRTLNAFAVDIGEDYGQLYRFLHGQRDLRLSTAARIAKALKLELRPAGR
jgi:hypothetical protein